MRLPVLFLLSLTSACATTYDATTGAQYPQMERPADYQLVWADEFETGSMPDSAVWSYDTERNMQGWWNGELQYYSADRAKNARIENGHLVIEAHAEQATPDLFPDTNGQAYTSARLMTRGKAFWQYGYIEIRAKLPCGKGPWASIKTLPEPPVNWPASGEIDIVEFVGHDETRLFSTVHSGAFNHAAGGPYTAAYKTASGCNAFRTHTLHWTPDAVTIGVEGEAYFTYLNDGSGSERWPFNRPHHLVLNLAVGGWGDNEGLDAAAFPARMEIDYIRVYQKPDAS